VAGTEVCIGLDLAVAVVVKALDRLYTTAASHHHVMVLETMGRDTGWLTAVGGLTGGADVMCLPEFPVSIDDVAERLLARRRAGKLSSLVVVAEGSPIGGVDEPPVVLDAASQQVMARRAIGERLATAIAAITSFETRATVLGHVQQGGSPVATDRIWATRLGVAAQQLARSATGSAVAVRQGDVCPATLEELTASRRSVPRSLYERCCQVG
jgi:ATP-dependent phosphofructokinase / diphosphate-dependent phosphofructokinase